MAIKTQLYRDIYKTTEKIWWYNYLRNLTTENYDNNGNIWISMKRMFYYVLSKLYGYEHGYESEHSDDCQ